MDAYPAAVTFSWYFNNSEHKEAINEERFSTNGLVSTLNFAPTTNQDYGTLFCLGENAVGHQDEPCAFKIVPTGKQKLSRIVISQGTRNISMLLFRSCHLKYD